MKTSNKIFISFLIFLFSGITALYIGSKYYGDKYDVANIKVQIKSLSPFSVIVAEPGAIFNLNSGMKNTINQPYGEDTVANFPPFIVRNDTLFISSVKQIQGLPKNYRVVSGISCVKVKSIVIKKYSEVRMEKFQADTLNVIMDKSNLDWRFENIAYLSIQAKDSEIYLEGKKLGELVIKLDKTRINTSIQKRTDALSGSLINASDLRFSMSKTVNLVADQTSNYDFYNFGN